MQSYTIHLIRHGQTQANNDGRYIGRTDEPLSPEGLMQLLSMKQQYDYPGGARFFTSPLTRCRQTLEVLYPGCHAEVVDGLAECDFGEWDGKSRPAQAGRAFQPVVGGRAGGNSRRRNRRAVPASRAARV